MTMTRPCRRMILHFSHIFLMLGRTFMTLLTRNPPWHDPGHAATSDGHSVNGFPRTGAGRAW